jgi:hypothetical protein
MTEVHIIGIKYTDYFTDGTTTTSYPGDPDIDSHFSEANAAIPVHEGLTWVHTAGHYLYDTPSGDLEPGDYAYQVDGSIVSNPVASNHVFVSSTSTPATGAAPTSTADTSSSTSDSVQSASIGSSSTPAN